MILLKRNTPNPPKPRTSHSYTLWSSDYLCASQTVPLTHLNATPVINTTSSSHSSPYLKEHKPMELNKCVKSTSQHSFQHNSLQHPKQNKKMFSITYLEMQISLQDKWDLRSRSLTVPLANCTQVSMARRYVFILLLVYKLHLNHGNRTLC